jgi:TolB-like protein/Tfp pilus assembly protein PilF
MASSSKDEGPENSQHFAEDSAEAILHPTERFRNEGEPHGFAEVGNGGQTPEIALTEQKPYVAGKPAHQLEIWRLLAFASVVVLTTTAALLGLNFHGLRDRFLLPSPKSQIQALAVLPLTDLSGDSHQEYFADGITEALITKLGNISTARVISRQSVMQYKGSKKPLQEIAHELNVDAILEGAVERSGDEVRVTVRLVHVNPESQIWANQYNRDIRDAIGLQDAIARAVSDEVQVQLMPNESTRLATNHPVNPEALDHYLRGLYVASKYTENDMGTAIGHFKAAIEKDPTYAPAYAELSMAYFWLGNPEQGGPSARETMPRARAAVTKALQLTPSLARAHLALGLVLLTDEWNWAGAENQYQMALKLNPNCAECHAVYGALLMALGRDNDAVLQINRAIELDPLNTAYREQLVLIGFCSQKYDLAITQSEDLNSNNSALLVGLSYAEKGMYPEAISNLEKYRSRSGQAIALGYLAHVYGRAGKESEARKIIRELKQLSTHHYVFPSSFANAYLGIGEREQALTWLERAYEEKDPWLFYLKVWPALDPLRSKSRFQALLHRVNFPH